MQSRRVSGWKNVFLGALTFFLTHFPDYGHALLVTRFIDSNNGDPDTGFKPIYSVATSTAWNDQTCAGCFVIPSHSRAFQHTWMSATYHPNLQNVSFTLQFTGVSISVFFILPNGNVHPDAVTNTHCNFSLDGQHVGSYSHNPDLSTTFHVYNASVFSKSGLSNSPHQLIVSTNDYPESTFMLFDYAIYEAVVSDSSITSATPPNTNSPQLQTASTTSQAQASASSPSQSDASDAFSSNPTSTVSSSTNNGTIGAGGSGILADSSSSTTRASPPGASSPAPDAGTGAPRTSQKTNIILGSAIGGAVLIIIALLLLRCLRRSKSANARSGPAIGFLTPLIGTGIHSSTALAGADGLPSAAAGAGLPSSSATSPWGLSEKLSARERDVTEQLQSAQREMDQFEAGMTTTSEREIVSLNNQIEELRAQLSRLQNQRQSIWFQGQIDEQPPAYTRV